MIWYLVCEPSVLYGGHQARTEEPYERFTIGYGSTRSGAISAVVGAQWTRHPHDWPERDLGTVEMEEYT